MFVLQLPIPLRYSTLLFNSTWHKKFVLHYYSRIPIFEPPRESTSRSNYLEVKKNRASVEARFHRSKMIYN